MQDPLSALDAHVGESVFNNVFLDRTSGTTRILVTHALHFLPKVDYIYIMVDGRIAERGTFDEMMANRDDFSRTFDEFITNDQRAPRARRKLTLKTLLSMRMQRNDELARRGATIMQAKERNIGAVNLQVYKH